MPANTVASGAMIVLVSCLLAAISVLVARRFSNRGVLTRNQDFINATYPIVGLVYGTFLAFAIVITWGQFTEAETSTTNEVTHLSELWRNAEAFPADVCSDIHDRLLAYVGEVEERGWDILGRTGKPSEPVEKRYQEIWQPYYHFEPETEIEKAFYSESVSQLNELGRDRRHKILFAGAEVQPLIEVFLISGGILIVAFSLLLGCPSMKVQIMVTTIIAGLISFSIFLVLSLQQPFSGDVSVDSDAFSNIKRSFEKRNDPANNPCGAFLNERGGG